VILPKGEVCCGAPLRGLGLEEEAIKMAEKNQKIFSRLNIDAVLSLCPTCLVALKNHYPKLIGEGIENATDVSSFLCQTLPSIPSRPPRSIVTATYHDPCHLMYSLGIKKEPRQLIQHVGVRLLEAEGEGCCGFGGIFSLQFQEVSQSLRDKRINTFLRNDADAIVTACPGCMTQLSSALPERQVLHVIELVEESIC
jgi:glycolate oxidase iron-sulfur subunit